MGGPVAATFPPSAKVEPQDSNCTLRGCGEEHPVASPKHQRRRERHGRHQRRRGALVKPRRAVSGGMHAPLPACGTDPRGSGRAVVVGLLRPAPSTVFLHRYPERSEQRVCSGRQGTALWRGHAHQRRRAGPRAGGAVRPCGAGFPQRQSRARRSAPGPSGPPAGPRLQSPPAASCEGDCEGDGCLVAKNDGGGKDSLPAGAPVRQRRGGRYRAGASGRAVPAAKVSGAPPPSLPQPLPPPRAPPQVSQDGRPPPSPAPHPWAADPQRRRPRRPPPARHPHQHPPCLA